MPTFLGVYSEEAGNVQQPKTSGLRYTFSSRAKSTEDGVVFRFGKRKERLIYVNISLGYTSMAIPLRATNLLTLNDNIIHGQQQQQQQRMTLLFPPQLIVQKKQPIVNSSSRNKRLKIVRAASASPGTEASAVSEETLSLLDSVRLFDLNGSEVSICDLWKDRKAVVAFARHFGCVLCRKRADYLAAQKEKMDEAGVALVLIGPGNVDQAKTFAEQTKFKGEIYADPSNSSYSALRFVSGISTTFTPGAGLKIVQAYMEGYRQDWGLSFEKETRTRGGWQQGGIIVAGPGKYNVSYIHKDKEAGDDPDIEEILRACCP